MRFLHLADLHLGKQLNGFSLVDDQRAALADLIERAGELGAHALVLAGDLYDKASPSAESVALLDWLLTTAAEAGLAVLAVPGNHDSAERVGYAAQLLARQSVFVPGPFDGTLSCVTLEDDAGPVRFWLMPFLKPALVRPHFPDADIAQSYTAALEAVIGAAPIDPHERNVLVAHQFVTFGSTEPERCDSELIVGGVDNVDARVFDTFDYVALGHLHRPQRIGRDTVRYAGSLLKYSLSEVRDAKSAVLVDVGTKAEGADPGTCVTFELVPIRPPHDVRVVRGPLAEICAAAHAGAPDAADYVHAALTDEAPSLDALRMLRAVYPNLISFEYDNEAIRTARTTGASAPAEEPAAIDAEALFARFFEEQNGFAPNERQQTIISAALARATEGGAA